MAGLGGQTPGESSSRPDPGRQRSLRRDPSRLYENEASHRSAGEVHLPSVNSRECTLVPIWPHSDHQVCADDPQCHVSADHEAETAHHLDLVDSLLASKRLADPAGKRLVIGHALPILLARREATKAARNNRSPRVPETRWMTRGESQAQSLARPASPEWRPLAAARPAH